MLTEGLLEEVSVREEGPSQVQTFQEKWQKVLPSRPPLEAGETVRYNPADKPGGPDVAGQSFLSVRV